MIVKINDKVTFRLNNIKRVYTIVNKELSDLTQGKLSVDAPLAQCVLGKKEGDIIYGQVPAGKVVIEIIKVEKNKNFD